MKNYKMKGILCGGALFLCCGCGQLSTNSQDVGQIMHKKSTLSTEQSTNVDKSVDNTEDLLITYEETTENRTENVETEQNSACMTEQRLESSTGENIIEEASEQSTETATQEALTTSTEGQSQNVETIQEDENLQEVFSDASYYYSFYASIFHSRDESTALTFDQEAFESAYEELAGEVLEDYFEDCQWIMREEGISLSLTPKACLFPDGNADVYQWEARCIRAFALLRAAYETDEYWDHGDSLKPQYHCHAIYARQNKVPWNIEPYRTETSFLRILLTWGNPES